MSNLSKELVEMQILLRKYKVPQRSIDKIINREKNMQDRIDKAIEYIEELIADTKGMLNDMKYQDKEETITRFVEDLKTDIKHYEHLEDILRGEDNEWWYYWSYFNYFSGIYGYWSYCYIICWVNKINNMGMDYLKIRGENNENISRSWLWDLVYTTKQDYLYLSTD